VNKNILLKRLEKLAGKEVKTGMQYRDPASRRLCRVYFGKGVFSMTAEGTCMVSDGKGFRTTFPLACVKVVCNRRVYTGED